MKTLILIFILMAFGIFTGVISDFFVHEMGHYTFASIINSSAIEGVRFYPESLLASPIENKIQTFARVSYKSSILESFGFHGGLLVTVAGFLFEVIFLVSLVALVKKQRHGRRGLTAFLLGALLGALMGISASWINDFIFIFYTLSENTLVTGAMIIAMLLTMIYLSVHIFLKASSKFFGGLLPRRFRRRSSPRR
ncbi:MAG: hypothetical protein V1818_01890 [Candidatus Aenigmatarchaeota archaeon]